MQRQKIKRSHIRLRRGKRFRFRFFLILIVLMILAIIHIWQRVTILTLASEIKGLNMQIEKQQKEYKYLQVEIAYLSSVERIERLTKEMGFTYPSLEQIGLLPEVADSDIHERPGLIKEVWTKLKGIFP